MATIGKLNVILSASTASFSKGLAGAKGRVSEFATGLGAAKGALAALGAGVSVAGIVALTKSSLDAIDANGDLAQRLGMTTDRLGGLQHAAKLAGVGGEELGANLQRLQKTIGEAVAKGGEASAAFTRLGLSAKMLSAMTPDQQLKLIATAFQSITSPAEQARIATDLFGRSGYAMINVMQGGAESLDAAYVEAVRFGSALNQVDTAKVQVANDALDRLRAATTGLANKFAVELAPAIEAAAVAITDFLATGDGVGAIIPSLDSLTKKFAVLADIVHTAGLGIKLLQSGAMLYVSDFYAGLGYIQQGVGAVELGLVGWLEVLDILPDWLGGKKTSNAIAAFKQQGERVKALGEYNVAQAKKLSDETDKAWTAAFIKEPPSTQILATMEKIQADAAAAATAAAKSAAKPFNAMAESANENAKKVKQTLADLQKEYDTLGMSDTQKKLYELQQAGMGPDQLAVATRLQREIDQRKVLIDQQKVLIDLRKEAATAGMSESQKKNYELQQAGASPAMIAEAAALRKQIDLKEKAAEVRKELAEDAKATPMGKYEAAVGDLKTMLDAAVITWDEYGAAIRKARKELESETASERRGAAGVVNAALIDFGQKKGRGFRGQGKTNAANALSDTPAPTRGGPPQISGQKPTKDDSKSTALLSEIKEILQKMLVPGLQ